MKLIKDFQEFLEYVNRVGAIPIDRKSPGWIPHWQSQACDLIERVEKICGSYPITVQFKRPVEGDWRSYFLCKVNNLPVRVPTWKDQ